MAYAQPRAASSRSTSGWKNAASMRNSRGRRPAKAPRTPVDQLTEKRGRLLGVVHVARAVLDAQDVAGLRDVGEQRIVTAVLPMVGIEGAKRPGDGNARAD